MCDPTIPPTSAAANLPPCPPWCEPKCCTTARTADGDSYTDHAAAPSSLLTPDEMWEAWLICTDEHAFPDETGGVHLQIDVTNTALPDPSCDHVIPVEDIPRLARFLMDRYEQYLFSSTRQGGAS